MSLRDRIVEIIGESGVGFVEKKNTIRTTCPLCGRDDKFSILKDNGSTICYRATCEYGKRWFEDWIHFTFNLPYKEARDMLHGENTGPAKPMEAQPFKVKDEDDEDPVGELPPMQFPEFHMVRLDSPGGAEGLQYVVSRGITPEMASKYDLAFSNLYRRVYIPIMIGGLCYGYQGRHIDQVDPSFRMRNNEGFARESLVMFADNLKDKDFAILCEGPFDALKFESVGGNIATMGKVVTNKQLDIIKSYGIRKLYLALDADAAYETNEIVLKGDFETYLVKVPPQVIIRAGLARKKADFGECTFEECKMAFENAQRTDPNAVQFYVNTEVK